MAFSRRMWELTAAGFVGYFALAWVWRIATMRWGLRGSRYPGRTLLSDRHGAASISEPPAVQSPGILIFADARRSFRHSPTQRKMLQTQAVYTPGSEA
jgi:hypothetical protein